MQTISRSKSVFIRINKIGRVYLPFIKELETYPIKYVDTQYSVINDPATDSVIETITSNIYLTLVDHHGNIFYDNINLNNFLPGYYIGMRKKIDRHVSLQNCFIENTDEALIGSVVMLTFMWDEPRFSQKMSCGKFYKETVELLLQPSNNRKQIAKIKFPDLRNVAGKRIRSIRPAYWQGSSITPLGYQTITQRSSDKVSVYLTLANGNNILIDGMNIWSMIDFYQVEPLEFENILINFPDSFVEVIVEYEENNVPTDVRSIPLIIEYMED